MVDFALSRSKEKVLPQVVYDGEKSICIDADFRTVLKCFRILSDPSIENGDKRILLLALFFKGVPVSDPVGLFCNFAAGKPDDDPPERVMDFEQDADAIYASFMKEYGIDLFDIPFLHWSKFLALLSGIGENTALGARIALRSMDTKNMSPKDRAKIERAKRRVALNEAPMPAEEADLIKAVDDALASGSDASAQIKALNDYYKKQGGEDIGE